MQMRENNRFLSFRRYTEHQQGDHEFDIPTNVVFLAVSVRHNTFKVAVAFDTQLIQQNDTHSFPVYQFLTS